MLMQRKPRPSHEARDAAALLLRQAGISATLPRLELLLVLQRAGRAMTAQAIYLEHVNAGLDAQLSSIYVNLKRLEQCGIIIRYRPGAGGKSLYALRGGNTAPCQLVCQSCGRLLWLDDPRIEAFVDQLCRDGGFSLRGFSLLVDADCRHCAKISG